jgi:hypothetical protein
VKNNTVIFLVFLIVFSICSMYFLCAADEVDFNAYVELKQGYENNVDLDPDRHKDGFTRMFFSGDGVYKLNENMRLRGGLDAFTTIYYKYNRNNVLDLNPYVLLDWYVTEDFRWRNRVAYEYYSYPNYKENTYSGLEIGTFMRQYMWEEFYHELGYEYSGRWYPDRKRYLVTAARDDQNRVDGKNRLRHIMAYFPSDRVMFKLGNNYYFNSSNDQYQDYYDYWAYKIRPSVLFYFTDKFYAYGSFSYMYKHYTERRSTENVNRKVREYNYRINTSFYYDLTNNVTLGLTYSYVENRSNDPFYKYSGSTVSGSVGYTF